MTHLIEIRPSYSSDERQNAPPSCSMSSAVFEVDCLAFCLTRRRASRPLTRAVSADARRTDRWSLGSQTQRHRTRRGDLIEPRRTCLHCFYHWYSSLYTVKAFLTCSSFLSLATAVFLTLLLSSLLSPKHPLRYDPNSRCPNSKRNAVEEESECRTARKRRGLPVYLRRLIENTVNMTYDIKLSNIRISLHSEAQKRVAAGFASL